MDFEENVIDRLARIEVDGKWARKAHSSLALEVKKNAESISGNSDNIKSGRNNWKVVIAVLAIFVIVIQVAVRCI